MEQTPKMKIEFIIQEIAFNDHEIYRRQKRIAKLQKDLEIAVCEMKSENFSV